MRTLKRKYDELYSSSSYAYLPDVVLLKIFRYLDIKDRCRAGGVCRRWYHLSRHPSLWKQVNVRNMTAYNIIKIIPTLPSCVTHLQLHCLHMPIPLTLPEVMAKLHERCPSLKTFILDEAFLMKNLSNDNRQEESDPRFLDVLRSTLRRDDRRFYQSEYCRGENVMNTVLPELSVLSLSKNFFNNHHFVNYINISSIPKIKVLDLTRILSVTSRHISELTVLGELEELYLARDLVNDEAVKNVLKAAKKLRVLDLELTSVTDSTVTFLKEYGRSLEKLYLGSLTIRNVYLTCEERGTIFTRLQTLCLRHTLMTSQNVENLLNSCPLLTCVDVSGSKVSKVWWQDLSKNMKEKVVFDETARCFDNCEHFKKSSHFRS